MWKKWLKQSIDSVAASLIPLRCKIKCWSCQFFFYMWWTGFMFRKEHVHTSLMNDFNKFKVALVWLYLLHCSSCRLKVEQQAANNRHQAEVMELQRQLSRLNSLAEKGSQALQQKAQVRPAAHKMKCKDWWELSCWVEKKHQKTASLCTGWQNFDKDDVRNTRGPRISTQIQDWQ